MCVCVFTWNTVRVRLKPSIFVALDVWCGMLMKSQNAKCVLRNMAKNGDTLLGVRWEPTKFQDRVVEAFHTLEPVRRKKPLRLRAQAACLGASCIYDDGADQ